MSSTSIATEDPEYYAELLKNIPRLAERRLLSNERSYSDVPGIQGVGDPLARRLQTLLDILANISLCQQRNVSATTACLKGDKGTLETRLYIVFNHEDDEAASRCPEHLQSIFKMLGNVSYKSPTMDGSPKVLSEELEDDFINICRTIHNYSFNIFAHRVTKRRKKLSAIREYIEQDQEQFSSQQRDMLAAFLLHVDLIIKAVDKAEATKQLSINNIRMLLGMYSYWTEHNILPKDPLAENKVTLLDHVDTWLTRPGKRNIGFQLRRWALKIMSLLISANRLFLLTQSRRLRKLIEGKFSVQVLTSPSTTEYHCDLSSETIQVALNAALAGPTYQKADRNQDREWFIDLLLKGQEASTVVRQKPTVHAELAMIMEMAKGKLRDVEPYIGVSKLACIMCSHYIRIFNEVTEQKIAVKGCHGKAYPGWFWPSLPDHDGKLRPAFLGRIRQQLRDDFEQHVEARRLSDSSVGSDGAALEVARNWTLDEIADLYDTE